MNIWKIGDVTITRIVEMETTGGSRFILPDATRDAVLPISWLTPHFMDESGNLKMSVHALVIESCDQRIVVDTCIGNDKERSIATWNKLQLPFLEDLKQAGFERHNVDTVLCTHLHVDHVGWNTMLVDGTWLPTFPNARYLMARAEYEYWDNTTDPASYGDIMSDSVRPVFDAGLVDLVEPTHQLTDEVRLVPTPGHTPGHVSVSIQSKGSSAIITGDFVHHPCQMAHPEWQSSADYDADQAIATRTRVMNQYVDTDTLVIGTHFATPTAGYIKRDGDNFWLDVSRA